MRCVMLCLLALLLCSCSADVTAELASPIPPSPNITPSAMPPAPVVQMPTVIRYAEGEVALYAAMQGDQPIAFIPHAAEFTVLAEKGEWLHIAYQQLEGYILAQLAALAPSTPKPDVGDATSRVRNARLIVKKTDRVIEIYNGDVLYATYPIGLGWQPIGHKQVEGDGRTPEGEYYICVKNPNSRYYLSLGVSYPNSVDAAAGFADGRIDAKTREEIIDKIEALKRPPWGTALGGEIMIHGCGAASDWTAGCIAVDNEVMDVLFAICSTGTPLTILP